MVNNFLSMSTISSQFRGATQRRSRRHFSVVLACCQPSEVESELRLKPPFGYSADPFTRDAGFTRNFSHRHCRNSLDAFVDELAVPSGVDCELSAAYRMVIGVAELDEIV